MPLSFLSWVTLEKRDTKLDSEWLSFRRVVSEGICDELISVIEYVDTGFKLTFDSISYLRAHLSPFLVKVVNPLDESEAIMCNIYTWFYLPKWYTARSSMQVVVCVTMYRLYKTVSGTMLYQQRYTQSNPLNERWRQTISRWRFVYCVQWNKTAHSYRHLK